ncbi:uncharacterized protein LOC130510864 [Raphanus sativus]|uniref:Uncharacterized protein LOC130510864 n=1 Tax=Raphanus sativus TaxID=3726 RepID=A0A9W3DIE4_RAPSA|nr:uncharacterized protein LOC130510864 [Raphanus sativus]
MKKSEKISRTIFICNAISLVNLYQHRVGNFLCCHCSPHLKEQDTHFGNQFPCGTFGGRTAFPIHYLNIAVFSGRFRRSFYQDNLLITRIPQSSLVFPYSPSKQQLLYICMSKRMP